MVARCTVERLMKADGLHGVCRGTKIRTTRPDPAVARPEDLVERQFSALSMWRCIDVFSRMITGWRAAKSMITDAVLDALEMGIWQRRRAGHELQGLVHHSDAGSQYTSIRYTERLAEASVRPSIGSVGDLYDNALAESVIGLFKTELIRRRGP